MTAPAVSAPTSSAELRRGSAFVRVATGAGAPILALGFGEHDWCAAGAWSEYAPTAAACSLPTFVAGSPRNPFPEGGLLAVEEPELVVRADGVQQTLTAEWPAITYPLRWRRVISLTSERSAELVYTVMNTHRAPLPFVWGLQIPLAWNASPAIDIAKGARARVSRTYGEQMPLANTEFAWPVLLGAGRTTDASIPSSFSARTAVACYVELARGTFAIRHGAGRLEVAGDEGVVAHAHVWVNNDAETPGRAARSWWSGRAKLQQIVVGPALGAPGSLSDAVGAWNSAQWLEPGETRRWTIRCSQQTSAS